MTGYLRGDLKFVPLLRFASILLLSSAIFAPFLFSQEPSVQEILIDLSAYAFTSPEGTSGSPGAPPVNVLTLKNGQPTRLIFRNVDPARNHSFSSPLFALTENTSVEIVDFFDRVVAIVPGKDAGLIELAPAWKARVSLTPNVRSAEDGIPLTFDLSCHRNHGTPGCHILRGMKGLITVTR